MPSQKTLICLLFLATATSSFALPAKYAHPSHPLRSTHSRHSANSPDSSEKRSHLSPSASAARKGKLVRTRHSSSNDRGSGNSRLQQESHRILQQAVDLVEQAAPVPHQQKYRIVLRHIDGRNGKLAEYRAGTIVLDAAEAWSVDGRGRSGARDAVSVVAHEIACHDPSISLKHNSGGALTNPQYTGARRINHFDRPDHNGKVIRGSSGNYGWVITTEG